MKELDIETLNSRLLSGHRLLVERDKGRVVACVTEFFDEPVALAIFESYLANGIIEVPKDRIGFKISKDGKNRLKAHPRRDD